MKTEEVPVAYHLHSPVRQPHGYSGTVYRSRPVSEAASLKRIGQLDIASRGQSKKAS